MQKVFDDLRRIFTKNPDLGSALKRAGVSPEVFQGIVDSIFRIEKANPGINVVETLETVASPKRSPIQDAMRQEQALRMGETAVTEPAGRAPVPSWTNDPAYGANVSPSATQLPYLQRGGRANEYANPELFPPRTPAETPRTTGRVVDPMKDYRGRQGSLELRVPAGSPATSPEYMGRKAGGIYSPKKFNTPEQAAMLAGDPDLIRGRAIVPEGMEFEKAVADVLAADPSLDPMTAMEMVNRSMAASRRGAEGQLPLITTRNANQLGANTANPRATGFNNGGPMVGGTSNLDMPPGALVRQEPGAMRDMGVLGTNVVDLGPAQQRLIAQGRAQGLSDAQIATLIAGGVATTAGISEAVRQGAQPGSDLTVPAQDQATPLAPGGGVSDVPAESRPKNLTPEERGLVNGSLETASYAGQQSGDPAIAEAMRIMQPGDPSSYKNIGDYYAAERAYVEAMTDGQINVIAELLKESGLPEAGTFANAQKVMAYRAAQKMPGFEDRMSMQTGDTVTVPKATTEMGSDTPANMQGAAEAAGAIVETSMLPDAYRPAAMQGNYDLATATQPRVQGQLKTPQQLLQEQLLGSIG
jgi:hypothetical protein